jgi:hypothetical protein
MYRLVEVECDDFKQVREWQFASFKLASFHDSFTDFISTIGKIFIQLDLD